MRSARLTFPNTAAVSWMDTASITVVVATKLASASVTEFRRAAQR